MRTTVKDRWKSPRGTIAQAYENNDYGYVFHAGILFLEFLRSTNLKPSELNNLRILDYGCGTGRVTRFVALTGAKVTGYDPTPECIEESKIEELKSVKTSLMPVKFTSDFSEVGGNFDIVFCINVLDHLTIEEHRIAVKNIVDSLKEGGECYLWINKMDPLPMKDSAAIRALNTNVIIVRGKKINGDIQLYEKV